MFEQYWPDSGNDAIYGPYRVTLEKSEGYSNYVCRAFQLTHNNLQESRLVSDTLPNNLISIVNFMSDISIPLQGVARSWSSCRSSNTSTTGQAIVSHAFSRLSSNCPLQVGPGLPNDTISIEWYCFTAQAWDVLVQ